MDLNEYKPRIGKNVIETLTLGMYEDARFIYREYVQNAADQIDVAVEEGILNRKSDGKIDITIDKIQKMIIIEDNATGIKSNSVLKFLGDVADSQKDRTKRKGFRGIGRLGGLGYCEKLIFETSYKGEAIKSIITLNAKQLKKIIEDRTITMDAATVISVITSFDKTEAEIEDHFFKVELQNVTKEELLEEDNVRNYLSMVAPIPFSKEFLFWKKIHTYFNENNVKIEEYDVHLNVNEEKLYKAYKPNILKKNNEHVELLDVDFFKIKNEEDKLIALGWYGISKLLNKIIHSNNIERGVRIRKDNIQIGDEDTLNRFFKEDRFNHHFIGEIHVLGTAFIPNARRDYFNENRTIQIFENELKKEFNNLYRLAHTSSNLHNRFEEIQTFRKEKQKFDNRILKGEAENQFKDQLSELRKKAQKAKKTLEKIAIKAETEKPIEIIYSYIIGYEDLSIEDNNNSIVEKQVYRKPTFSQLSEPEKKIIFEIFAIIDENLPIEDAEKIKKKITERYN